MLFRSASSSASASVPASVQVSTGQPAEPLGSEQWDMTQIGATPTGSYRTERGSKAVKVGILDSGVDMTHPDIAANFDLADSRNFAPNIPALDGNSTLEPVGTDPVGHGTAVASLVAAPINGVGMSGVAPNVTLVDLRVAQTSGNILIEPFVDRKSVV